MDTVSLGQRKTKIVGLDLGGTTLQVVASISASNTISFSKLTESDIYSAMQVLAYCKWDHSVANIYVEQDGLIPIPSTKILTVSCQTAAQFNELIETVAEFHQDNLFTN